MEHYSKSYSEEPDDIRLLREGAPIEVARPNHSLGNGIRSATLSVDAANLIMLHDRGRMGTWIQETLELDPDFLDKIYLAGLYYRAARRGEGDNDREGLQYRSGYLFRQTAAESNLFTPSEVNLFAKAHLSDEFLSIDGLNESLLKLDPGQELPTPQSAATWEERCVRTLLWLGHMADHRRMLYWTRTISFEDQRLKLKECDITGTLANKIIFTLWTRSGHYLKASGAADVDLFHGIGGDTAWNTRYQLTHQGIDPGRHYHYIRNELLFFELEKDPERYYRIIKEKQSQMPYDQLLDSLPSNPVKTFG